MDAIHPALSSTLARLVAGNMLKNTQIDSDIGLLTLKNIFDTHQNFIPMATSPGYILLWVSQSPPYLLSLHLLLTKIVILNTFKQNTINDS